jgi:hypothetical protein
MMGEGIFKNDLNAGRFCFFAIVLLFPALVVVLAQCLVQVLDAIFMIKNFKTKCFLYSSV